MSAHQPNVCAIEILQIIEILYALQADNGGTFPQHILLPRRQHHTGDAAALRIRENTVAVFIALLCHDLTEAGVREMAFINRHILCRPYKECTRKTSGHQQDGQHQTEPFFGFLLHNLESFR